MKYSLKTSILLLLFFIFVACNSGADKKTQAEKEISAIEQLINNNFYNLARIKIDSFHINYRMMVDKRRVVASLEDTITLRESYRTIQYCDTVLPVLKHQLDSMSKNFRFEKDTAFQETGDYVHKLHQTEQNVNRNYIKVKVDENGELKLFSHVKGTKIAHRHLKILSGDFFAETDTLLQTNISEHGYNDGESSFESVIFGGESVAEIVKFIYDHQTLKQKVILTGNREYTYFLTPGDIKAISESYHFWIVKRDVVKLERQLKNSNNKIIKIKSISNNQ